MSIVWFDLDNIPQTNSGTTLGHLCQPCVRLQLLFTSGLLLITFHKQTAVLTLGHLSQPCVRKVKKNNVPFSH